MNKDDLVKLLDLSGKQAAPSKDDTELSITPTEVYSPITSAPASSTVLELDDWGMRRGAEVLRESERLQTLGLDESAIADFFGAAFEPEPRLHESCVDQLRHDFVRQLLETPEYNALHTSTLLNQAASAIATTSFAEQFAALRKETEPEEREGGKKEEPTPREKKETKGEKPTAPEPKHEGVVDEMKVLRAVGQALTKASEEVEEAREAGNALGMGNAGSNDAQVIARMYRKVRSNPMLRRICELAGRYRRFAQSKQRRKLAHGMDDMVGVVLDGDLGRVLPQELAKLALPEFEWETLRRLVERQVLCRDYHSMEPVAKGPVIVATDESGSMSGDKGHTAKALALALAWVARQQQRWIALCAYSGDSGERLLALPPGRWNELALMEWLCEFIGHGSDLDVPVREMPRYYEQLRAPRGVTDVVFITDAQCRIPQSDQMAFNGWKKKVNARLITLVIEKPPGDLTSISDELHRVQSLSVSEAGVERVLSI